MGENGDVHELFLGSPNLNWFTEYRTSTITKKCYGLRGTSPFRMTSERVNERRRKRRALTFFPRTSLPSLVSLAELSELSESLLAGCYGFHFCERWLHRHHNGSVQAYPLPQKHLSSPDISFGSRHLNKSGQNCSNSRV